MPHFEDTMYIIAILLMAVVLIQQMFSMLG